MTLDTISLSQNHAEKIFVGGKWIAPSGTKRIPVLNPATGESVASIPEASTSDADLAVSLANKAFEEGPWSKMSPAERGEVLDRVVELLEQRTDELVGLVVSDLGSAQASSIYVHQHTVNIFRSYAQLARAIKFEEVVDSAKGPLLLRKEPVGTVLAVVPWNGPSILLSLKIAPALLAGCSVVVKPAPETPLASLILADILAEAGVPEGVVSILPGGRELGEHLSTHSGIDVISFTGGTAAGKAVMAAAAQNLARVTLELGGKSAAIVLDDIEPSEALPMFASGMLHQSGQVCTALTRILVSRARHDEWVEAIAGLFNSQKIGDPADAQTTFGPLSSEIQRERVEGHISKAVEEGGTIVVGGKRPAGLDKGFFLEPTLIDNVLPDSGLAQDEVFGPVFAVITYEDVDDAVRIANNSKLGLSGAVMTGDVELGIDIGRRIRTGTFSVNGFGAALDQPFGGFKQSGIGREGGLAGLESFLEVKQIQVPGGTPLG